ncbi:hypothetical protein [Halomonas sp. 328]|uniref:hypothetical protein n=1 Tax=Halomonas sp. 328 TaxID=2776704 RepID=UPI0018A7C1D2|nr:hypothetical protein [Halomonas sp. 328]MBF8222777.1 hypothetical protein [Halomonas sp. 328]
MRRHASALFALLCALWLAGCTVNTFPDGSRETLWGVPEGDEPPTRQERQEL